MIKQSSIKVKCESTDNAITNFSGIVPLSHLGESLDLFRDLDTFVPCKQRARGYSNSAAVFDLMCIPLSGGSCIDDLAQLRADKGVAKLLGRRVMAPSTAHDFLRRIMDADGLSGLDAVRRNMIHRMAEQTQTTVATIDCDASLFTSGGADARMSYKGERGYMPMFAFWEELGVVLYEDFRTGNAQPGGNALDFLTHTLEQLPSSVSQVNIRSDSAWYQHEIMDYCEEHGYQFCIGADKNIAVKESGMAVEPDTWQRIFVPADPDDPEEYIREWASETVHSLTKSKYAFRLIVIRKERKQGDLFEGDYHYHYLITNMDLSLEEQIAWYRKRGQCENKIKELKWDFNLRVLPSGDFEVNAVYMRIITIAYNVFVALKTLRLKGEYTRMRLKSLYFKILGIPAMVVSHARKICLKLPREHPHAQAFREAIA